MSVYDGVCLGVCVGDAEIEKGKCVCAQDCAVCVSECVFACASVSGCVCVCEGRGGGATSCTLAKLPAASKALVFDRLWFETLQ